MQETATINAVSVVRPSGLAIVVQTRVVDPRQVQCKWTQCPRFGGKPGIGGGDEKPKVRKIVVMKQKKVCNLVNTR